MKFKAMDVFLCIICAVFFFSLSFTIQYYMNLDLLKKESNSFYSENALFFTASKKVDDVRGLYRILPNQSIFFAILPSDNWLDIRGIAVKGGLAAPPLSAGRFFTESDFPSGPKRAVVGSHADLLKVDGVYYFPYKEDLYEVIGVIGYSFPSKFDDMVMLSLSDERLPDSIRYVVDSGNLQNNADVLGQVSVFGEVLLYDPDAFDISKVIDRNQTQKIVTLLLVAVLLCNVLVFIYFWIDAKADAYSIKKANGFTSPHIIWETAGELVLFSLIAAPAASAMLMLVYGGSAASLSVGSVSGILILLPFTVTICRRKLKEVEKRKLGGYS